MLAMAFLILITAISATGLPIVKAQPIGMLFVDPPYQEVQVCTNFMVKVNMSVIRPVSIVAFNLTFDPNLMECLDVTNTSFPPGQILTVLLYNNTVGWVVVVIEAVPPFSNGTVAEIWFHCKAEGVSPLNFTDYAIELANDDGETLPAELFNGTVNQVMPPVGGEVLTIDSLALLIPWIATAGAVAVATVMVLTSRRTSNH